MTEKKDRTLITDPDEIAAILNTGNEKQIRDARQKMNEQAQRSLWELERQMIDLVCQILGFVPTVEQRKKHGKVERKRTGELIMYWDGIAFLKVSPVRARQLLMRVGEQKKKIKFEQDYHILKDDPVGYKKANPKTNYVATRYPDGPSEN